ncbi:agmatinase [Ahrensia sp. R2A130]|uniref:agmatinase n=1 Tax=Ahrensia sp. R2A130 TaxID=744979 RepID=UPI0001E0B4E3|nr:agmatinase [Ahrensia sp. R2A130]EFL88733.1 agmatinase [Ahrensia sp. R2A130]
MSDAKVDPRFQPVSGFDLPRFAGVPSFMRLPHIVEGDALYNDVQIGLVGVPWDGGTTNRPGARHGPRQLRDLSTMIRAQHQFTGVRPFELVNCADLGDVPPNPADLMATLDRVAEFYSDLKTSGIVPLTAGGDHLISLPILRGLSGGDAVSMIHFDSHTDLFNEYFGGTRYTHGTPFRRAIEEGILDPKRTIQIGIRGTMYDDEDRRFAADAGVTLILIEELMERGVTDVMAQARDLVGDTATYVSYDIDFIDPAFAPGTGTPEIGGPDTFTAQAVVRELAGLNLIGADLVEVSPPFDPSGNTAWVGVSIMFELLCVLAPAVAERAR